MHPHYITLSNRAKNMTGQRFGRLVALGPVGKVGKQVLWHCLCDCGTYVSATQGMLHSRSKQSCGCLHRESAGLRNLTHGMTKTPLYGAWRAMVKRCTNPKDKNYTSYGGRGIHVCGEWLHNFEAFYNHVTMLPNYGTKGYSLDRIDNNGNYEPGNVRWASSAQQNRNTRDNIVLTFDGKEQCLADWAEETGIQYMTLFYRLKRGWDTERALTTPACDPAS